MTKDKSVSKQRMSRIIVRTMSENEELRDQVGELKAQLANAELELRLAKKGRRE